jgi:FixJ family two-component response regulator
MKKKIIIIEDEIVWLNIFCEIINNNFDVEIERFSSFKDADTRLVSNKSNFDLLITDIYPSEKSKDYKGLKFVDLIQKKGNIPVIIVTGESDIVKSISREYKVDVFDKANFESLDFIRSINKVIPFHSSNGANKQTMTKKNIGNTKNKGAMLVYPNPFLLPETKFDLKENQIFVVQAYSIFNDVYPEIKSILEKDGFIVKNFTDRDGQVIFNDIWVLLNESIAVIVDFTQKRPNVYLEFGMALVLGKPIIAITQSSDDIPSDTPNLKYIVYKNTKADRTLEEKLVKAVKRGIEDAERLKSI